MSRPLSRLPNFVLPSSQPASLPKIVQAMEGKKQSKQAPSSSSPPSSSSLSADLFGGKNSTNSSSSSFFHSVFPPAASVMKKNSWKQAAQNASAEGNHEKIDPCTFSSSLYYGGQDICTDQTPASRGPVHNHRKEGEDESNAASRGNWWQGSLYY